MNRHTAGPPHSETHLSRAVRMLFPLLCGLLAAAPLWGPGIVATRGGGD